MKYQVIVDIMKYFIELRITRNIYRKQEYVMIRKGEQLKGVLKKDVFVITYSYQYLSRCKFQKHRKPRESCSGREKLIIMV